ncbi:MAG: four helix bundle protein [Desulfobacteraceae bacterium]|nr:MAG: four helix bundle protein [Desulfobacteraceae bacterium]
MVLKELNETKVWLQILLRSHLITKHEANDIKNECDELCRIISASINTSLRRNNN